MTTPADQITVLYVPCGSEEEAARIATTLVEEGLAACGNIYTSRSIYRWQGEMVNATEYVLFAKTAPSRVEAARTRVRQLHSYEVPCVLVITPDAVNHEYATWVHAAVSGAGRTRRAGMNTVPAGSSEES
jgi:periplasmic divalent cation tolerance protein